MRGTVHSMLLESCAGEWRKAAFSCPLRFTAETIGITLTATARRRTYEPIPGALRPGLRRGLIVLLWSSMMDGLHTPRQDPGAREMHDFQTWHGLRQTYLEWALDPDSGFGPLPRGPLFPKLCCSRVSLRNPGTHAGSCVHLIRRWRAQRSRSQPTLSDFAAGDFDLSNTIIRLTIC